MGATEVSSLHHWLTTVQSRFERTHVRCEVCLEDFWVKGNHDYGTA